jgi:molecular chaperone DnaK
LGADIDYSIDPMTVVARGAALYASTIEIDSPSACIPTSSSGSKIAVKLAFEPTCPDLNCVVAGKIDGNTVKEIQIDSKSGFWSSGWIPVSKEDRYFETDVTLQEMKMNVFYLYARDGKGTLIEVEPGDFSIRQGLAISSPPLPRAVCVEIIQPDGTAILEPLFTKGTLLPIERTHKFRSNKNLRPSEPGSFLAIKIWEGEELSEPQNNTHIGNVYIRSELLRRPIPEGTEIELSIKIDSSRLTAVDAFVPYLNDHFTEQLYVSNKIDSIDRFQNQMPADVDNCINRCAQISSYLPGDQEIEQADNELADLQKQVENLDMSTASKSNWSSKDADRAAQLDSTLHDISLKLWKIEQKHGIDIKRETNDEEDAMVVQEASAITEKYGTELEKKRLSMLKDGLNHLSPDRDSKRKKRIIEELNSLRWGILFRQPWYLKDLFNDIKCNAVFTNKVESNRWLSHGEKAISEGNLQNLRESIGHLFKLLPAGIEEVTKESAVPADLRRY